MNDKSFKAGPGWLARHRPPLPNLEALALALVQDLRDPGRIESWISGLSSAVQTELARDRVEVYRRTQE